MNKNFRETSLVLTLLVIFLSMLVTGCKEENNPSGSGSGTPSLPQVPTSFGGVTPQNVLVAVRGAYSVSSGVPGIPNVEIDYGQAVARFNQGSPTSVSVVANNTTHTLTKDGSTFYFVPNPANITPGATSIGINYTGNAQFTVQGYNLTTNTISVPSRVSISNLATGANLNKNANFQVSWTGGSGGTTWQVFIIDSRGNTVTREGTSGSSTTFPSSALSGLSAGSGFVIVLRYTYTFSNNQETVLVGEAVSSVSVNIQ
ncbi:MAG: hypothetical protein SNJ55_00835 [Chloroherpetonaceae bacterium]